LTGHPAAQLAALNLICEFLESAVDNFETDYYFFGEDCVEKVCACLQSGIPEVSDCALRTLSRIVARSDDPRLVSSIIVSTKKFRDYFPPEDAECDAFALFCGIWENVIYGINKPGCRIFQLRFNQAKGLMLEVVPAMLPNISQLLRDGAFEVKIAATMIIAALIQTLHTETLSPLIDALGMPLVIEAFIESMEEHDPERFQKIAAAIIAILQWAPAAGGSTRADIIAELERQGLRDTLEGCASTFTEPGPAGIMQQLIEEVGRSPTDPTYFL
jgi:hypothetical protein